MNISNEYRFLYDKMRTSLLQHKENLIYSNNNAVNNSLVKRVYVSLDKLLKDIITTTDMEVRNSKIIKTFQWYKHAMKEYNVETCCNSNSNSNEVRCTNINFYFPFEKQGTNNNNRKDVISVIKMNKKLNNKVNNNSHSNNSNNNNNSNSNSTHTQTNKTRNGNLIDCVQATKKCFNVFSNINLTSHKTFHNNVMQLTHNNQYHHIWFNCKNNTNNVNNIKDNFKHLIDIRKHNKHKHKHSEHYKQRKFPLTEGNSNNSFSNKINREIIISVDKINNNNNNTERSKQNEVCCDNKKKKVIKRYKIKKRNNSISKSAFKNTKTFDIIKHPNTADSKIIDIIRGVKLDEENYNKEILSKQYNLTNRKQYYNDNYKSSTNTLDFRKTVSNFKHIEFKSLHDYLKSKKRIFNAKALYDAFIDPEYKPQSTFYLPKAGSGLLSKPDYLD